MFCRNCGKQAGESEQFCTSCGNLLRSVSDEVAPVTDYTPQQIPKDPQAIGRFIKTLLVVIVAGGFVIYRIINTLDSGAVNSNNSALESYDSGNSQQAAAQFQSASQNAVTNTTKVTSLINLGYVYTSDGKNDLALSTFKEALSLADQDSFQYYLISGEIALIEKKPNAAQFAYKKAYEISPDEYQINSALALFYLDLEEIAPQYADYKKALTYAQKAYEVDKSEVTKQNLAIAYYFNENYNQTIALLSTTDFAKHPYGAYWLGLAYAQKNDTVNAKTFFKKALAGGVTLPQEISDYMNSN